MTQETHAEQEAHAEAGHGAADAGHHAESALDPEVLLHHVQNADYWELGPFATVPLNKIPMPSFELGGLPVDLAITKHVLFLIFATVLTIVTMVLAARASRRLDDETGAANPKAPRGVLNAVEAFYVFLRDQVVMANIGRGGERFAPLVLTLFFFILYTNLLGLVPFGATATGNIWVTGALAVIALVVVEASGFVALGPAGYARTIFFLPAGLPAPLRPITVLILAPVEFIAKFSKIMALAIRLFANMTAGHIVLFAFLGLILTYGGQVASGSLGGTAVGGLAIVGSLALALFVMMLEIFISLLQAYIFAMLVSVFIGLIRHAH